MKKDEIKNCPRCGVQITCKSYDIKSCDCSKINLTKEQIDFIHSIYRDCLCNKCLEEMKDEFQLTTNN